MIPDWQNVIQDILAEWQRPIAVVAIAAIVAASLLSAAHVLLVKREPRSALGWFVACLGFPLIGPISYVLFGVNRIRTRAQDWRALGRWAADYSVDRKASEQIGNFTFLSDTAQELRRSADTIARRSLLPGCDVKALYDGEGAYPLMLQAIAQAQETVYLSTFIFEGDQTGRDFISALIAAKKRGVDVRVIIDGVGCWYSWPKAHKLLRRGGVSTARFLPPSLSKRSVHLNLRNHRKILVVDGHIGFTGGMNIGGRHVAQSDGRRRVTDIHFQVTGPVLRQFQEAFLEDWFFITRAQPHALPKHDQTIAGSAWCRGISAGPNEDAEVLRWIILGAIASARQRVRIMTPYFIPDVALISALCSAAIRGVAVEIIVPRKNNLPYVAWASQAFFWELLRHGVKIYYREGTFAHSKILLIDDFYNLVGSANLDPRSLRLNFEFNLEVFDTSLAAELHDHFEKTLLISLPVLLEQMDKRPVFVKLRDGFAKLFSPYF